MIEIKIDAKPFEDMATQMGAAMDQMPYALSRALNDSVFEAREHIVEDTWPSHVQVRSPGFISAALRVEPSTKQNLVATIYDRLGHGNLKLHADGGRRVAHHQVLAIPTEEVKRSSQGVRKNQLPRNLANSFIVNGAIYQRRGKRIVRMYTLAPSAEQPHDVPFREDFEMVIREGMQKHFPDRMMQAMKTRR